MVVTVPLDYLSKWWRCYLYVLSLNDEDIVCPFMLQCCIIILPMYYVTMVYYYTACVLCCNGGDKCLCFRIYKWWRQVPFCVCFCV